LVSRCVFVEPASYVLWTGVSFLHEHDVVLAVMRCVYAEHILLHVILLHV